jgi:hypothetical protein
MLHMAVVSCRGTLSWCFGRMWLQETRYFSYLDHFWLGILPPQPDLPSRSHFERTVRDMREHVAGKHVGFLHVRIA